MLSKYVNFFVFSKPRGAAFRKPLHFFSEFNFSLQKFKPQVNSAELFDITIP